MIFAFIIVHRDKIVFEERLSRSGSEVPNFELLVGIVKTLKSLGQTVGPSQTRSLNSFTTSNFKVHSYQTLTGWEFILVTSPDSADFQDLLQKFYVASFIPQVLLDPLRDADTPTVSPLFQTHVRSFLGGIAANS